ncbi:MAG: hypothetical protein Q7K43_04110, partial [Candidatus Woesearchaeota archaeon]|nr:hypothetical protein [Candidatus Woesearchaeota archaeon]
MSWFSDNCLKHKKDYSSVQCVCVWPERNPSMMFSAGDEGREKGAIGVGGKKCYYESSELLNRRNRLVEEWKKAYLLNEQVFDRVRSAVFGYVVVKQVSGVLGGIGIAELQTSGLVCTAGIEDIVSLP